ncbi:MAG: hypothetical protein QHH74_11850 [Spirochaetota bacterium]|nr:hypothetical protein [Spirochaetota bacterium]
MFTQFDIPKEVVDSVMAGTSPPSVYSPYMKSIHNKHVIGINVAFMIGDWIDMVFFGDNGFFLKYKAQLAKFPGLKVTCYSGINEVNWVKYLVKDGKKPRGISSAPNLVSWNGNSGAAAISIAAWAGAKRIILLGFDMALSQDNRQHWHNLYGKGVIDIKNEKKLMALPFQRHLIGFPIIAEDANRMGIEILNASPQSSIREFRKVTVKEILSECN